MPAQGHEGWDTPAAQRRDALDPLAQALLPRLPEVLQGLALRGFSRHYRKGTLLIDEGTQGDDVYVLLQGSVRAFTAMLDQRQYTYATHHVGDFFGEMALDGGPRSASVEAIEPVVCVLVTARETWRHAEETPAFARMLIERLIQRARWATESARELALLGTYERLSRLLDSLAGEADEQGERWVAKPMTQQEIAEQIACSREMVSRLMKDLQQGGYVALRDRRIALLRKLPQRW